MNLKSVEAIPLMALLAVMSVPGCGSRAADTFTVTGAVMTSDSDDDVLPGVTVRCGGFDEETVTAADGSFRLECPLLPADDENETTKASTVWFMHPEHAPVVRSVLPYAGGEFTLNVVMAASLISREITIPVGNTSVPAITGAMTLSFEKDALLDPDGVPVVGAVTWSAASWDNSLPVELDEGSQTTVVDALYPAWGPFLTAEDDQEQWMRPLAAGWFDPGPNSVNPDIGVDLQLFSQFADDVIGRQLSGAGDQQLFLLTPESPEPLKVESAALTSMNQLSATITGGGLYVWMAPQDSYACFDVMVKKGDLPVEGAHVKAFQQFAGENQIFLDQRVGSNSENGGYCLKAVSGTNVLITVSLATLDGISTTTRQVLAGGNSTCQGTCTPVTITFPCENNDDCNIDTVCDQGVCVPETTE